MSPPKTAIKPIGRNQSALPDPSGAVAPEVLVGGAVGAGEGAGAPTPSDAETDGQPGSMSLG
jgi:hypothetical protein